MTAAPSRRGLFALLAGAAVAPTVAKPILDVIDQGFAADELVTFSRGPIHTVWQGGYVVTREILEDDLYAEVVARRAEVARIDHEMTADEMHIP